MNQFEVWENERPESFLKHATVATSQYDKQYRSMAAEILALREARKSAEALAHARLMQFFAAQQELENEAAAKEQK